MRTEKIFEYSKQRTRMCLFPSNRYHSPGAENGVAQLLSKHCSQLNFYTSNELEFHFADERTLHKQF